MRRPPWIVLAIAALVLLGVVVALNSNGDGGGLVAGADLRSLAADGVRVIDVRTVNEFEGGHIPGAENVPLSEIAAVAEKWDPTEPIALYCATGNRSADAASTLRSMGFKTVYDLSGGMAAWDGEIEGESAATAVAVPPSSGLPVMYEFYTDW